MDCQNPEVEVYEFKEIHALNFKCDLCAKTYTTESGIQKHIGRQHQLEKKLGSNYSTFVGKKRVKVRASQNNNCAGGKKFCYKCSMCDKTLFSREGIEIHLKTFHGVTLEILTDLYSLVLNSNTSSRQFKVFVTPVKVSGEPGEPGDKDGCGADRHDQLSEGDHCLNLQADDQGSDLFDGDHIHSESFNRETHRGASVESNNVSNDKPDAREFVDQPELVLPRADQPDQAHGTGSVTKPTTSCVQKRVKRVKQRMPKPSQNKTSQGFCKELSNMFVSGSLKLEKFSMYGSKETQPISHPASLGDAIGQPNQAPPQAVGVPLTHSPHNAAIVPLDQVLPDAFVPLMPGTASEPRVPDLPQAAGVRLVTPELSPGWIHPLAYAGIPMAVERGIKRKRKTCGEDYCGPCSVQEDCSSCRYCLNKKLK